MGLITFNECPFCGDKPDNYVSVVRGMSHDCIKIKVICRTCDIEMSELVQSGSPYARVADANDNLIEKWNRRTENA